MCPMMQMMPQNQASSGGRLVTPDGRQLALQSCSIKAAAGCGLAEVTLRQTFYNDSDEPLQVTYQVPLPDAALGGYSFRIGDRRVVGKIETREEARKRFEDAVLEGRSAALLEQERSSLFTQEIGNIPPRTKVVCELILDQKLRWLQDGQWEWRFPTVIAPRYMGEAGQVPDQDALSVDVLEGGHPARADFGLTISDPLHCTAPSSPSHAIVSRQEEQVCTVTLQQESGARLDRDIVVRWMGAGPSVGATIDIACPDAGEDGHGIHNSAYALLTITPPNMDVPVKLVPRDVILLIDTSGSMSGAPLNHAQKIALGLIEALGTEDTLEMIAFSMKAERWAAAPKRIDAYNKSSAAQWIRDLRAGGGTEMQHGFLEALKTLRRNAQRQVILLTDGLVGFERDIVGLLGQHLPEHCRVHTVGIGPAANRSLTGSVARAGRGEEFLVDLQEDPQTATARIVQRLSRPMLTKITISGSALREIPGGAFPDLCAGAPALIPLRLDPNGGTLVVRGQMAGGAWGQELSLTPCSPGTGPGAIARLYGRECAEHIEMRIAGGEELDDELERIGLSYRIATRRTSWIAVSEEPTVDPTAPIRRVKIAHSLPAGLSAQGVGISPPIVAFESLARLCHPIRIEHADSIPYSACIERSHAALSAPQRPSEPESAEQGIVLFGVLRSLKDGRAVIEIELFERLFWDPDRIVFARKIRGTLARSGTTARGRFQVGQTIRLVITDLAKSATIDKLQGLIVVQAGDHPDLRIEVRPA